MGSATLQSLPHRYGSRNVKILERPSPVPPPIPPPPDIDKTRICSGLPKKL